MLLNPLAIDRALEVLEPDGHRKFYRASLGLVYRAIRAIHTDGNPVDEITLAAFLERHGKLEAAGGAERVHELAVIVPAFSNVAHYATIVRETWQKREIGEALYRAADKAWNGAAPDEAMEHSETAILELRDRIDKGGKSEFATMHDLAQNLEDRVKDPPPVGGGVPCPFSFLKPMLPGRLYVLSGYTGDGKTVAAVQFAKTAAKRALKVGFFSIEMSKEQLFDRFVSSFGIPLGLVESGRITDRYRNQYRDALREVSPWRVDVLDDRAANATTFQRFQRLRRYDLLIIDHLHEIDVGGRASERRQHLEDEVRRITTVARTENVPVLLLAQLSRPQGSHGFPRPTMAMLRETARIEQSAAQVAFIWRKRDDENMPLDEAEFIVAKNRFGPLGRVPLQFVGENVRFVETIQ